MERTASEKKRIGKIHAADATLNDVVANEMARIRQAFDKRVVEHTEELVTKVQKGEPLSNKTEAPGAPKKK